MDNIYILSLLQKVDKIRVIFGSKNGSYAVQSGASLLNEARTGWIIVDQTNQYSSAHQLMIYTIVLTVYDLN